MRRSLLNLHDCIFIIEDSSSVLNYTTVLKYHVRRMNSQITALTQTSSTLFQQRGTLTKRSSPRVVCQAQPKHQVVFETVKQAGLIAAAAGILSLVRAILVA